MPDLTDLNAPGLGALVAAQVEAVQFLTSPFLHSQRAIFVERIREMKLPAIYEWPETVEEGGLVSYGPRITLCFRHVAVLVNKVLRGAKPTDLPIEQPTTFTLAINTGAAHAVGLQVPENLLLRADVVGGLGENSFSLASYGRCRGKTAEGALRAMVHHDPSVIA